MTFDSITQDLRHGVKTLRRDAGVSSLIILVLALGIGGSSAIFTLLSAAFLDPLPYQDAGRLVTIIEDTMGSVGESHFVEIRRRARTFDQLAFIEHRDMQLTAPSGPVRVYASHVSASFFELLGANASLGRTFLEKENRVGAARVIVVSDRFWRTHLQQDPQVVGRTIRLDGKPVTVVGVLPSTFHFDYPSLRIAEPVDVYAPYLFESNGLDSPGGGGNSTVRTLGRLREGATFEQAQSELDGLAAAFVREYPARYERRIEIRGGFGFIVRPLRDAIAGSQRGLLWLLVGGVGLLLFTGCANTAQLLLARSIRRGREVAIRSALGASRPRLIRQFLIEGLLLATAAGGAGLVAAPWLACVLVATMPSRSPLLESAQIDARTLVFTAAVSLLSALAFAIVPALKGSRWTLTPALNSRAAIGEGNRWRHAMVALEATLSVFLLCGAALVAENLWTLMSAPMGFDPNGVTAMRLKLPLESQFGPDNRVNATLQRYMDAIDAIPGVESAASVTGPPLMANRGGWAVLDGVIEANGEPKRVLSWSNLVSPNYFETLRIPLLAGRTFRDSDALGAPWVMVVNEEYARQFGLGAQVIGKQITEPDVTFTVVGLVSTVRSRRLNSEPFPESYLSAYQIAWANTYLVVRSGLPRGQLVRNVEQAVQSIDPDQAVYGVQTMEELVSNTLSQPRFNAYLVGAFALLAVAMAATGLYGVVSSLVSQRTSEIAVRLALGAGRGDIARTFLGSTCLWVVVGIAGGVGLGYAALETIRSLSSIQMQVSPKVFSGVVALFLVVTVAAVYAPVRRASRTAPASALRAE